MNISFALDLLIPRNWTVWIGFAVLIAATVRLAWNYSMAVESRQWPHVPGTILRSWVKEIQGDDCTCYSPRFECAYDVNGVEHRSEKRCGRNTMSRERAEGDIVAYPVGLPVDVCYDPEKPDRSTLTPGETSGPLAGLILCILLLSLFAVLFATKEGQHLVNPVNF